MAWRQVPVPRRVGFLNASVWQDALDDLAWEKKWKDRDVLVWKVTEHVQTEQEKGAEKA